MRAILAASASILIFTGCMGSHIQQTQFYSLNKEGEFKSSLGEKMTIGLGPIYLASHLDRPNLVRQSANGKFFIYDTYRWKESLDQAILLGVGYELKSHSPDRGVVIHPWYRSSSIDYQVILKIDEFEPNPEGNLKLSGSFEIIDKKKNQRIRENNFAFELKMPDQEFSNQVKLMRESLQVLASEINRNLALSFSVADKNKADD